MDATQDSSLQGPANLSVVQVPTPLRRGARLAWKRQGEDDTHARDTHVCSKRKKLGGAGRGGRVRRREATDLSCKEMIDQAITVGRGGRAREHVTPVRRRDPNWTSVPTNMKIADVREAIASWVTTSAPARDEVTRAVTDEVIRTFCRVRNLVISNPRFYLNRALTIAQDAVADPNDIAVIEEIEAVDDQISSGNDGSDEDVLLPFSHAVREAAYRARMDHLKDLFRDTSKKRPWLQKVKDDAIARGGFLIPRFIQKDHHMGIVGKVLRDRKRDGFRHAARNQRSNRIAEMRSDWDNVSRRQRRLCEQYVMHKLRKSIVKATLKAVIKLWRTKLWHLQRRDPKFLGHCRSCLSMLKMKLVDHRILPEDQCGSLQKLKVVTHNLGGRSRFEAAVSHLVNEGNTVIALQETWQKATENLQGCIPAGWRIEASARPGRTNKGGGVATLINKGIPARRMFAFEEKAMADSDCETIIMKVGRGRVATYICNVYVTGHNNVKLKGLAEALHDICSKGDLLLLGDVNWNFLKSDKNCRGRFWLAMMKKLECRFISDEKTPTFRRVGCQPSLIDHIWASRQLHCDGCKTSASGSEHDFVSVSVSLPMVDLSNAPTVGRIRWERLREDRGGMVKTSYERALVRELKRSLGIDGCITLDILSSCCARAGSRVCGVAKRKENLKYDTLPYWNKDLTRCFRNMKTIRRKMTLTRLRMRKRERKAITLAGLRQRYCSRSKEFRELLRRAKNEYFQVKKLHWWRMRSINKNGWSWHSTKWTKASPVIPHSNDTMIDTWDEIFGSAPAIDEDAVLQSIDVRPWEHECDHVSIDIPTLANVLKKLKSGKAAGLDGVPSEAFKWLKGDVVKMLGALFEPILNGSMPPLSWKISEVCLIPKVPMKETSPSDFRPITLLNCISKVLEGYVLQVVEDFVRRTGLGQVHEMQGGFRAGRSALDQVWLLQRSIEFQRVSGRDTFVAFLDIRKAYDTVPFSMMMKRLVDAQFPDWFIQFCYRSIQDHHRRLRLPSNEKCIKIRRGLPQGSVLSPFLFNVFIDSLVRQLESKGCLCERNDDVVNDTLWCGAILYADDIALSANSLQELQEMIDICSSWALENGMEFSSSKSKWMGFPSKQMQCKYTYPWKSTSIVLDNNQIERVDTFEYLGVMVSDRRFRSCKIDCSRRLKATLDTLGARSFTFNPKLGCPVWVGRMFARASYVPRAFYGVELGCPVGRRDDSGSVAYHSFARKVLSTFDCTSTKRMLSFLGWPDYKLFTDMAFLRYFVRLVNGASPASSRMTLILLSTEGNASSSVWWRSVVSACERVHLKESCGLPSLIPEEGSPADVVAGFIGRVGECAERVDTCLHMIESTLVPHASIDIAGMHAVDVFTFYRGFFNPRDGATYPHVDCYFCHADGGDTPGHLATCVDDRVARMRQNAVQKIGWSEQEVIDHITGDLDWEGIDRRVVLVLAELLHQLVNIRRQYRLRSLQDVQ